MKLLNTCTLFCLTLLPIIAQANWTGIYTGLNGGYGFGEQQTNLLYLPITPTSGGTFPSTLSPSLDGGTFGGQVGFDWQLGQWFVLGLKYDMDWSGLTSSTSSSSLDSFGSSSIISTSENVTWFGNLLPRLGFLPLNNVLIYGTGGLAFGHINGSANQDFNPTYPDSYPGSINNTLPGWSAGGGIEWKVAQRWSLAAEYLYNQFENQSIIANDAIPSIYQNQYTFKTNFQTIEGSLNYRF